MLTPVPLLAAAFSEDCKVIPPKHKMIQHMVLSLLSEREMAIPQVNAAMDARSKGRYTISGSYALFYRLTAYSRIPCIRKSKYFGMIGL